MLPDVDGFSDMPKNQRIRRYMRYSQASGNPADVLTEYDIRGLVINKENHIGVKAFAVATIDEGIRLRRYGVSGEILVLGYTAPARAKDCISFVKDKKQ